MAQKIVSIDYSLKQINKYDQRWYDLQIPRPATPKIIDTYILRNLTSILSDYPKGKWFEEWLKENGMNADAIRDEASDTGRESHDLIDQFFKGNKIVYSPKKELFNYSLESYERFLAFCDWYLKYKPEVIFTEQTGFHLQESYGFTLDLLCRIDGEVWLIDFKTGSVVSETTELQLIAMKKGIEYMLDKKYMVLKNVKSIDKVACLHLNWKKYRVNGYKFMDYPQAEYENYWSDFLHLKMVSERVNKNLKPKYKIYPNEVSMDILNKFKEGSVIKEKYPELYELKTNKTAKKSKEKGEVKVLNGKLKNKK